MIDYQSLPPSVLAKIARLDAHCLTLTTQLEQQRRELPLLQQQHRDLQPRAVAELDVAEANLESQRFVAERQRLAAAITAQEEKCQYQEQRLRAAERVAASCKRFLHELPADARLTPVQGHPGNLDAIREHIKQLEAEISQLQALPVPSEDLADRIQHYVNTLAAKAQPVIQGIGHGQTLQVLYPLYDHANRINLTGFVPDQGNPLLLLALLAPERLVERLLQVVADTGIPATTRQERLQNLQQHLIQLYYDEEASITGDVSRSGSSPPWAVLMVQVGHQQQAAAA